MNNEYIPVIKSYNGINVLRDDLLAGGTKSILMPTLIVGGDEFVYATPVYGGFQIALSAYCNKIGKKATIFCAKRKVKHPNTIKCIQYGANVIEVPYGYLSVVEKRARDYCELHGAVKLNFGAKSSSNITLIADRMRWVTKILGSEPNEIFCAIGSGTLVTGILEGTQNSKVYGVQVGAEFTGGEDDKRLTVLKYHKSFDKLSTYDTQFPSIPNYDLKAWEYCNKYKTKQDTFFWNVL